VTIEEIEGYYYTHYSVNHSKNFVDPTMLMDTSTIEGIWNGLKHLVPPRKRAVASACVGILEFMWRRIYAGCLWDSMLKVPMMVKWPQP
jgi:hypothetical protein